jgi:uncharacterized protein
MTAPTITVLNVNRRERIPESAIKAVIEHIAARFQPDKIILFGSYAYGEPKPGSDVDLLVIMPTPNGDWPPTQAILNSLAPFRFGIDVLVRAWADVEQRVKLGDWFMEDVVTKGLVVYERPHD